jgi:hypothetical protein
LAVALSGSQPLWLGFWLLTKAKEGKSPTKGTLRPFQVKILWTWLPT